MTLADYAEFSNYAVASGTVVLALAFLAHLGELLFVRQEAVEPVAAAAGSGAPGTVAVAPPEDDDVPPRSAVLSRVGVALTVVATGLLVAGVVTRALASQRVPWGNMYEFGLTGVSIALVVYLVLVRITSVQWIAPLVTGFGLAILGLAWSAYVPAGPLVPALHSYWLVIHVAAVMIAGALFLVGASASLLYLLKERAENRGAVGPILRRVPTIAAMDRLAYRTHAVGFVLWTFGALIAGPIWAHYAWGRYWGWDPKEVWAFVTWVVYAGYLHARATAGWKGRRAAVIALLGFATFLFSYYGVNIFVPGLHSYAK
ncbi:MAG: c-type cytochrome biogenesis protein CcsB [Aeromicrobium sp.]|uniref:c-type cytochrome biogenesis protein CcsB n=1 Tax=Aeromicrobium sp. TaxID=1871063 RepID=UPI0025C5DC7D|nr:c-type cytochrome biogenesis protein CcsB [Aeromicrobium sp.]MCK5892051.1 c-type cytochrome biogenesis protein CcsB [Aeromicrobium sp.]MDF1704290.1 c-type cytochrome biogenesis protein CcsB [Aeromicrobium sp.]